MRLLREVEGSVLWLFAGNPCAPPHLRSEAIQRGVAAERLIFAPIAKAEDHLARHRLADLFLDTLYYNAHTSASDALWAGVPVVTRLGATFAGRANQTFLRRSNKSSHGIGASSRCSTPSASRATSKPPMRRCGSAPSAASRLRALMSLHEVKITSRVG
jgi:predicted O-linked N-acetylglucosamine transferase (SPINDLY family)